METRGATEREIIQTILEGEQIPAKHGRKGFRRDFLGDVTWQAKRFAGKRLEVYTVFEDDLIIVITVIVKYLSRAAP